MNIRLVRVAQTAFATYGTLISDAGYPVSVTLELPWRANQHGISCIPAGVYACVRFFSPRWQRDVFKLIGVPDRADCELHIGNLPKDTDGCVLIGTSFDEISGQPAITGSTAEFEQFMQMMKSVNTFTLTITESFS